jgi:DNA-binding transcriptional ArsR family regulator
MKTLKEAGLVLDRRDGRWIQVEHADGDKGWLHDTLVW